MRIDDFFGRSAVENVKLAIERAKQNQEYNSLLLLTEERALARAKDVDTGKLTGRLKGVPFVVKDNFLADGGPSTASSHMLETFEAPLQATAIERLEAEGAICIGKANLDAFAHGGSTENSAFGVTKNASDVERVAGGSSGGSAVAVALDIVPFALGTDTGGSIRQPASFNGVIGVKPTYGTVSRYGVVAMASGTDTIGCFATNASDAELVMSVMAGQDRRDMTTLPDFWDRPNSSNKQKIGLIRQFMAEGVDEDVKQATLDYAKKLEKLGYEVEEVDLPTVKYSLPIYYVVVSAEIASNLARYDGVHYGHRTKSAKNLTEIYEKSRSEGFEAENKRRIMVGNFVLSSGSYDAYYLKAQKARTLLINELKSVFEKYDMLLSPVAPTPAFKIGENIDDPIKIYLSDQMTVLASLVGVPAISAPAGVSRSGLPIGTQLIGNFQSDKFLLELAKKVEEMN